MENKYHFACQLIREAGQFIKGRMTSDLDIEEKSGFGDLVTNMDRETQDFLIAGIKARYPDDAILAEENGVTHDIKDGRVWVLDPIDGTVNFIVLQDDFCIMMAYLEDGVGQFGLIYQVMADKLYSGGGQFAVVCNKEPLPVYQERQLAQSLFACNSRMYAQNTGGVRQLLDQCLGIRMYGGAGISMSKVLSGQLLGYFSRIQVWDYMAAKIMGEGLGYCLLTLDGQEPDFKTRQQVMFIPKAKLTEVLSYLKGVTI
ncbi:inositol monophosphatase family protein [Streptococcus cuniculipharyngis]|uniref:Inositol monophosphatase family protein n=1 Tax=Streptococcus cuniculipharyngis TaxID=1562651 RepID=A0A5C5SGB2_9STRE|nr:inositol monophosphatase family protein [Streptococcus cuniculipharyngis]TWS98995.1 inositol monophosphatase family protein [Streptococcus cuniculipharyngis]